MKLYIVSIIYFCALLSNCVSGFRFKRSSGDGRSAIQDAIRNEQYDLARKLIESRPGGPSKCRNDLNTKDNAGNTALYDAANKDVISDERFEIIKLLLAHCADPNIAGNRKWTPLMIASRYGNTRVVKLLLENGANTHDKHSDADRTALHEAAFWGQTDTIKVLLEYAANANAKDKFGLTPLHFASLNGHYRNAQLLLQHGANIGIQNNENRTPLHDAIRNEHFDVAKLLIEYRSDANGGSSKCKSELNLRDNVGNTALYQVVAIDVITDARLEIVKLLLEYCADPNIAENKKWTPLMISSRYGDSRVVKLLLAYGATTHNTHADDDRTALHEAAFWGKLDATKVLLEYGANVNARDKFGYTPLHYASSNGHQDVVKLLLQHGAQQNANM